MAGEYIKFSKMSAVQSPYLRTPSIKEFTPGKDNPGVSTPIDYHVTGHLSKDVEVGKPVIIMRDSRNGLVISGIMVTSLVEKIELKDNGLIIYTLNSVYHLDWQTKE